MKNDKIIIKGAKENNLKNVSLELPRQKLIVFTGLSGSGKSSLAFNTIYEEGKRRYVDSLSSYARQFLGNTKRPNVESIEGLSPSISIEQKTTHNNPRSIVGTVTEIYDYLRLLYARIGKVFCPTHNIEIKAQKHKDIIDAIFKYKENTKLYILSPIVFGEKGSHQAKLAQLKREGFVRVKINDDIYSLDDEINLDKNKRWNIDIVIDRLTLKETERQRVSQAVEIALEHSNGFVRVYELDKEGQLFSIHYSCEYGDFDMPKIEPKLFSFNSPYGMCEECKGIGIKLHADYEKIVPNPKMTIKAGGIKYFENIVNTQNLEWQEFKVLLDRYEIPIDVPIEQLTSKQLKIILRGSEEEFEYVLISASGNKYQRKGYIEGIATFLERKYLETSSEEIRAWYKKFMSEITCNVCKGSRLNDYALAVKINQKNIFDICSLDITDILEFIKKLELNATEVEISSLILNETIHRLEFLINVGLDYLTLNRKSETLSGGEAQRIRLATQIGANLTGILYVLDEPSIGLHQHDNQKLLNSLKKMVEIGNTLIVVEHDEETILEADHIVDIGPVAGDKGGYIVAQGNLDDIIKSQDSITGKYLSGEWKIDVPVSRRSGNGKVLSIKNASKNNLKNIDVKIPLGKFVCVTGVSGSGKSTLVNEIILNELATHLSKDTISKSNTKLTGDVFIDKVIQITQSPIGRTPRSNPATYTSVFDDIRDIFANVEESRIRGYKKGRFSFNVPGGRCDKCQGDGVIKIEMHFLPDVYVTCDHCDGKRYNQETLEIKYHQKSINDVLNMRIQEAYDFFSSRTKIQAKLQTLLDVGLGYIQLGQAATTLSGGEAQRVKLATYLQKKPTGQTLFILDEPTTGLHTHDVKKLLSVLNRIVDNGDTVLVIEHNLDIIKNADYIIDLGPGGGKNGGKIIATGTPEQISKQDNSYTAKYLKQILTKNN
ncbi:excinuclease ABC subunit UvrA [Mycoplasma zalophi]|uniref:excinuclease ABC subunit UvrA n=1 Tax=Mycoplasma zalophi TaxID=191287 RepID=UPI0021C99AC3|nr:excinuclease ABC subunit UvrA [Mycoplasma zalophi]MCU4117356.1 excinuclease ABC subunit UvrA [Mycoplasma zalophi]